jgi:hypothetical protein
MSSFSRPSRAASLRSRVRAALAWALALAGTTGCSQAPDATGSIAVPDGGSGSKLEPGSIAAPPTAADPRAEAERRLREGPFADRVVRFEAGVGAGFGADAMPWVVFGGPRGEGETRGSTDVVSLGTGGSIVLAFDARPIVDGPGDDLIVFENAFRFGAGRVYAELGAVSVSDDGVRWFAFPCDAETGAGCAGKTPVRANVETNTLACTIPREAGGDAFDLASLGISRARFVRVDDAATFPASSGQGDGKAGFDLDAIVAIHTTTAP